MKLTVVIGLPASGKTTYLKRFKRTLKFDDVYSSVERHEGVFGAVKAGRDCIVADIQFCRDSVLSMFLDNVRNAAWEAGTRLKIELVFFANDAAACVFNAKRRARPSLKDELAKIEVLSATYRPPLMLPVSISNH
jgi:hypothetical protein